MRGYDAFAGVVKSGGRTRRAAKMQILDADHPDIFEFVAAKATEERKARALAAAGFTAGLDGEAYKSVAFQNSNLSVRVSDAFLRAVRKDGSWTTRAVGGGAPLATLRARELLRGIAQAAWECGDPGLQYCTTIQSWNPCPASGRIAASNPCSEYLFLDDTACNLASLNLLAFLRDSGTFDTAAFRADIETLLLSMEAIVDRSSYPTRRIAKKSRLFRPLGLGFANLGALLMSLGLPYDSDRGRGWAAAITPLRPTSPTGSASSPCLSATAPRSTASRTDPGTCWTRRAPPGRTCWKGRASTGCATRRSPRWRQRARSRS
jgi:ribonucleoside-diphosphate reductase alpha chain